MCDVQQSRHVWNLEIASCLRLAPVCGLPATALRAWSDAKFGIMIHLRAKSCLLCTYFHIYFSPDYFELWCFMSEVSRIVFLLAFLFCIFLVVENIITHLARWHCCWLVHPESWNGATFDDSRECNYVASSYHTFHSKYEVHSSGWGTCFLRVCLNVCIKSKGK